MIWLGYVARNFYKEQLHSLLSPQVNWTAALLFYFIYIVGILIFAVRPGLEAGSLRQGLPVWRPVRFFHLCNL